MYVHNLVKLNKSVILVILNVHFTFTQKNVCIQFINHYINQIHKSLSHIISPTSNTKVKAQFFSTFCLILKML